MTLACNLRLRRSEFTLDLDFESEAQVLAIIGPNGSGKSSLLDCIAGLHAPRGRIAASHAILYDDAAGVDLPPARRRLGYLPQGLALFVHLSVLDNVAFGLRASEGLSKPEARARARAQLDALDLLELAPRRPTELSGGEAQRVALARALAPSPALLLLDEAMAALDQVTRRRTRRWLRERLRGASCPAVVVTHDFRDLEGLADEVLVLERGALVQRGTPSELSADPGSEFVAEFFGRS